MEDLSIKKLPLIITDNANSHYHLTVAGRADPEKHKTRIKIAEFFLQSPYAGDGGPAFVPLTLPGKLWIFEGLFQEMCTKHMSKRLFFNGLEWSWPIIEQGLGWMPRRVQRNGRSRRNPSVSHYGLSTGRIEGFATTKARWLHIHSDTYAQVLDSDCKHEDRRSWFNHAFRGNTVIWMDFTSNACPAVMDTLINLGNTCRIVNQDVHIAVTLLLGRDTLDLEQKEDPLATRVHFINKCLNLNKHKSFELVDAWTYKSTSKSTMVTVIGKLVSRKGAA